MKIRFLLAATIAAALCLWSLDSPRAVAKELGIGSMAPELDIEHWIQDGNGFFKPVKTFDEGKVYVVEFWATWCGPCIQSMPHLAQLQNKYRGQNVQIVSVSDETVDEVKDLLAKENEQLGKTFAEITSAYSLTTDPDRSVHQDYMEAANQQGIPTSFIVGKTGVIEWIGHPMELDEPLESVVNDSWDREAFKAELLRQQEMEREFEKNMRSISTLVAAEKFEDAIALVEKLKEEAKESPLSQQWTEMAYRLYQVYLTQGTLDESKVAFFGDRLGKLQGDPYGVGRFGFITYVATQQGVEVGPLANQVLNAVKAELKDASPEQQPLLHNVIALLSSATGDFEGAIQAQQAAIDAAPDEGTKARLIPLLEDLKQKAAEAKAADSEKPSE